MYIPGSDNEMRQKTDLKTPVRCNYYHGRLLSEADFKRDAYYYNAKRWLLNRLTKGYGVVCGLDVIAQEGAVVVTSGLAIDRCGHEIVVPAETQPLKLPKLSKPNDPPQEKNGDFEQAQSSKVRDCNEHYVHLVICYHECESDAAPIYTADACGSQICKPATIRERYKLRFERGKAHPVSTNQCMPDFFINGRLDYAALARYVTKDCSPLPSNCCLPLANICVATEEDGHCHTSDDGIDISIRPVSFTNDLLFELFLALLQDDKQRGIK